MNEVTKLYEKAGVDYEERYNNCILNKEGECKLKCSCDICKYSEEKYIYPSFTEVKQLFLFQWVCKKFEEIYISYTDFEEVKSWEIVYKISVHRNSFEECLCAFINLFWQSLTEEDKQQIKEILE